MSEEAECASTPFVTVTTTADDRSIAERIARGAIERRLGACARIQAAESVYRWEGEIRSANEWTVEIKTAARLVAQLEAMILELHDYELPEIVAHPLVGGSRAYLDWLAGEVEGHPNTAGVDDPPRG
jgi:periplasmic divalent cation tolerance protein